MIAAGNGFLLAVSLHQHSETCSSERKRGLLHCWEIFLFPCHCTFFSSFLTEIYCGNIHTFCCHLTENTLLQGMFSLGK